MLIKEKALIFIWFNKLIEGFCTLVQYVCILGLKWDYCCLLLVFEPFWSILRKREKSPNLLLWINLHNWFGKLWEEWYWFYEMKKGFWNWKILKVDLGNGKWNVNSMWVLENEYENWLVVSWVLNTHIWGFYPHLL